MISGSAWMWRVSPSSGKAEWAEKYAPRSYRPEEWEHHYVYYRPEYFLTFGSGHGLVCDTSGACKADMDLDYDTPHEWGEDGAKNWLSGSHEWNNGNKDLIEVYQTDVVGRTTTSTITTITATTTTATTGTVATTVTTTTTTMTATTSATTTANASTASTVERIMPTTATAPTATNTNPSTATATNATERVDFSIDYLRGLLLACNAAPETALVCRDEVALKHCQPFATPVNCTKGWLLVLYEYGSPFTAQGLKRAGYTAGDLGAVGFGYVELQSAGFSGSELQAAGLVRTALSLVDTFCEAGSYFRLDAEPPQCTKCIPGSYAPDAGHRVGSVGRSGCPGQCQIGFTSTAGATDEEQCYLAYALIEMDGTGDVTVGWCSGTNNNRRDNAACPYNNQGYAYVTSRAECEQAAKLIRESEQNHTKTKLNVTVIRDQCPEYRTAIVSGGTEFSGGAKGCDEVFDQGLLNMAPVGYCGVELESHPTDGQRLVLYTADDGGQPRRFYKGTMTSRFMRTFPHIACLITAVSVHR